MVAGTGSRARAMLWGIALASLLGAMIVAGSRNLAHFDAALVGYTFATLFATFGITYRFVMWLERPPTRMYWRRGWRVFLSTRSLPRNLGTAVRRAVVDFAANRFIFRRGALRGAAHWLIIFIHPLMMRVDTGLVWWAFMIGMVSHLVMDTLTKEGVPWLLPVPVKFGLPPLRRLRITTGKAVETFGVFPLLLAFNALFYWANYHELLDILHHRIV